MSKSFKHSGDLGDIIFSLPTIRAAGGGDLFLNPHNLTRLNFEFIWQLTPLLTQQEYIHDVTPWNGCDVDYDLDEFRDHIKFNNLADSHLHPFGFDFKERNEAWLEVADPIVLPDYPIIIARSCRYHGNYDWWKHILPKIKDCCMFVGYEKDQEYFNYTFESKIPRYDTPDILTLARVIAGANQFVGNQGLPHALAEGFKKDLVNEVYWPYPGCVFIRDNAKYI